MLDLNQIENAYKRIKKVVHKTPFTNAPILSNLSGYDVYLKKENLQITGAFKLRGAFNCIASMVEKGNNKGVVGASAGNHAQGVAFSAKYFGIDATIIMPESTPLTKIEGVRGFGAKVILKGNNYDEAYAYAINYAKEKSLDFIHPFTNIDVMAGQGTVAIEMLDEIENLDAIIVPIGGGGLISGVATAVKAINPKCKIIGVSSKGAPAMALSYKEQKVINSKSVRTIADGIAVRDTSPTTLEYILKYVDEVQMIGEDEIANAILFLLEKQKILVEGAGAVGVALLMHNKLNLPKGSRIGIILSGGNIDVTMLSLIIEKGLVKSSRKMKLIVTLIDKAGSLMQLTKLLQEVDANIVQIGYDRTSTDLKFGDANVSVDLETKGIYHQEEIRESLTNNKFSFIEEH